MKNPAILPKAVLMAATLLTTSALSAFGGSANVSSARQTSAFRRSVNPIHRLLFPSSSYMLDDGSADNSFGLFPGGDTIVLNRFAVLQGQETINQVSIAWGTPDQPDPSLDGLPYTVCIWSDPNEDGSPVDAQLLATASGVVSSQGTDTFITTSISATIPTANFFVGFLITHGAGQMPCAYDQTTPTFFSRSYLAGSTTPGTGNIMNLNDNDVPVTLIESLGYFGNWLIRADSSGGSEINLTASKHRKHGDTIVALTWTPTGSHHVDLFRNQSLIATMVDEGSKRDNLGSQNGSFVYQVCVPDSSHCSNEALVRVRPHDD